MRKKHKVGVLLAITLVIALTLALLFSRSTFAVLDPAGTIAAEQRRLIVVASALCLLVVVPVFAMTIGIVWRYRESNTKTKRYEPEWDHSRVAETIWWGGPLVIILLLGVVIWQSSHSLDPFKPIASEKKPVNITVVALNWKWLFLYPEENIATVNYLQIPTDRPINFTITADAPMNSFWIPRLGGQIYAMPGMETKLHLMASKTGEYQGSSANLSGEGFAGMKFITRATSNQDYQQWVNSVKQEPVRLDPAAYNVLAAPSKNAPKLLFSSYDTTVYSTMLEKYMGHSVESEAHEHMTDPDPAQVKDRKDGSHEHTNGEVHDNDHGAEDTH